MSGTTLVKSTALLALAAGAIALPSLASAQEAPRDRGEHRGGGYNRDPGSGQMQARPEQTMRQPQFQRPQQMPQVQVQQQAQVQRGWQGRYQGQAQPQAQPQAVPQPGAGWQGRYQGQAQSQPAVPAQRQYQRGQYQSRNQGYVDAQRNRSYGGERHDGDRREGYRGGQYQGQNRDGYRGGDNRFGQQQAWHNDWRRDQRYNWQGYRAQNRVIFQVGRYYAPYNGYYYRPLGIGFFLDQAFFGENYWIGDPGYYRLPPAYGPYRWVRYYDDVLLVNIYTGEVVDEIHDFFW